jgi:hypothetical protein
VKGRSGPAGSIPLAAGLVLAACSVTVVDGSRTVAPPPAAADSLRGTVAVVGAEPLTRLVLRTHAGAVDLEGRAAPALRSVRGAEVRVDGRQDGDRFIADAFRVRAVDGVPAADGTLELDGDRAVLVAPDGTRIPYGYAPAALREHRGQRVWIAGPADAEPLAWGRIDGP